jgi:hypothetical protein
MPGVGYRIAGSTLATLLVLMTAQPAAPRDASRDAAADSFGGDRPVPGTRRGDDRYVPARPLFGGNGEDGRLLGGKRATRTAPDLHFTDEREEFLEDGGGISAPDRYFTDEREKFLEDGGGISAPDRNLRTLKFRKPQDVRGWRDLPSRRTSHRTSGSFTVVYSDLGDRRHLPILPASVDFGAPGLSYEPKVIDVASERLDRRPIPPSGIEVINAGGPKIIRIAQDYDRTATAAIKATDADRSPAMEPWSPAWLSWCSRNHRSFDADLGTYRGRDGASRFCTGE